MILVLVPLYLQKNEQEVAKQVQGNGEIIAIKDISDTSRIDTDTVYDILRKGNEKVNAITEKQIDLIIRVLRQTGILR